MARTRPSDHRTASQSRFARFRVCQQGRRRYTEPEIHVEIKASAPAGKLGKAVQKLTGTEPLANVKDELRRFKQQVETPDLLRREGHRRWANDTAGAPAGGVTVPPPPPTLPLLPPPDASAWPAPVAIKRMDTASVAAKRVGGIGRSLAAE